MSAVPASPTAAARLDPAYVGPAVFAVAFDLLVLNLPGVSGPAVVLHAISTQLVMRVVLLGIGQRAGALLAGFLYAVAPAHAQALAGDGLPVFIATALALAVLALCLEPRPRVVLSAPLYLAALLLHPVVLPLPILIGLAWRRVPRLHAALAGAVLAVRIGSEVAASGRLADLLWISPSRLLAGTLEAIAAVVPLGETVATAVLALAFAAGFARAPWVSARVATWCVALQAFALPWALISLAGPYRPGDALLVTLPVVALAAEASRSLRRLATSFDRANELLIGITVVEIAMVCLYAGSSLRLPR